MPIEKILRIECEAFFKVVYTKDVFVNDTSTDKEESVIKIVDVPIDEVFNTIRIRSDGVHSEREIRKKCSHFRMQF